MKRKMIGIERLEFIGPEITVFWAFDRSFGARSLSFWSKKFPIPPLSHV